MPKSTSAIRRPAINMRPWLSAVCYDLLVRDTVLHADIHALADEDGKTYFVVAYSRAGRELVARDRFRLDRDGLQPVDTIHGETVRAYWTRGRQWGSAHKALLARVRLAIGAAGTSAISVHCHYVVAVDGTPWPRGWVNRYGTRGRIGGLGVLPDWL